MDEAIEKLNEIKEFTGVSLVMCSDFPGIRIMNERKYFNVHTETPVFTSKTYDMLIRLKEKGIVKNVEPNGYKRIAIFI